MRPTGAVWEVRRRILCAHFLSERRYWLRANVAQSAEQLFRKQQVGGSSPPVGSVYRLLKWPNEEIGLIELVNN